MYSTIVENFRFDVYTSTRVVDDHSRRYREMQATTTENEVEVKVTFPITKLGPFERTVSKDTSVGTVLAEAMKHFEVHDESQFTYVLTHDGKELNPTTTVGSITEHEREVKFTLVKKITQG
jgi:hypothetical protein